ncbi:MAG TPA: prolipoprotein diacylglyceryl transferase [Acidothermaceae bacterium]
MTFQSLHDYIPSPSDGVWHLGPVPVRGYALCIIVGIFAAAVLADRRYRARGGALGVINEISTWAVPFGLVGGRLYHVLTDWSDYFGKGGSPIRSLEVWKGGLGIPGAVALGGLGVLIGCRRRGVLMPPIADAIAPGLVLAQGIGRWGNWFNQELYGRPTSLPWSVRIDAAHQCGVITKAYETAAVQAQCQSGIFSNVYGYFQPTFLYESIWDVGTAIALIVLDRKYKLGHGRVFALYLVIYGVGRSWIEALRIDPAHHFYGLRLNDWTSIAIVLAGVIGYQVSARRHPGREVVLVRGVSIETETALDSATEPASQTAESDEVVAPDVPDLAEPADVAEPPEPRELLQPRELFEPRELVEETEPTAAPDPVDGPEAAESGDEAESEPLEPVEHDAAEPVESVDEVEPGAEAETEPVESVDEAESEPAEHDEAEPEPAELADENLVVEADTPSTHGGES